MNKTTLLCFGVALAVGFLGWQAYSGSLPHLWQSIVNAVKPLTVNLQPAFSRIQTTWTNIPESIRGIILLGIPTAFATFFAWTKTRAMQKLQQTKLQANTQISQLTDQASGAETQLAEMTQKFNTLQTQYNKLASDDVAGALAEAQTVVTQQQQKISNLESTILELHRVIADLKMQVVEKVVVK